MCLPISLISVKCPDCGHALHVEEGRTQAFCSYCGSKIIINNENEYVFRHIDEAAIKISDNETKVKLQELEAEKKTISVRWIMFFLWIFLTITIIAIMIKEFTSDDPEGGAKALGIFYFVALPFIIGGGVVVLHCLPEREKQNKIKQKNGIKIPSSMFFLLSYDYDDFANSLRALGFMNIKCVPLYDSGVLNNKVESFTIDGKEPREDKYYLPDSQIVVSYHCKKRLFSKPGKGK